MSFLEKKYYKEKYIHHFTLSLHNLKTFSFYRCHTQTNGRVLVAGPGILTVAVVQLKTF